MDASVLNYFRNILDLHTITPDGNTQKVHVFFATAERRYMSDNPDVLDKDGTLKKPFIRLKRVSFDRTRNAFYGAPGDDKYIQIVKQIHGKTSNVQNLHKVRFAHQSKKPQDVIYEIISLPFPDYSIALYEAEIETVYISTEVNEILETIWQRLDWINSFKIPDVGTKATPKDNKGVEGFFYTGILDPDIRDESNLDDYSEQERIIKHVLAFKVGCIVWGATSNMPNATAVDDKGKLVMRRQYTAYKIKWASNDQGLLADSPEELAKWFD